MLLFRLSILLLALLTVVSTAGAADLSNKTNEIKKIGKCSYEITVKIVLHGWPGKNNATKVLAEKWKKGIESKWNGPSKQVVEEVSKHLGLDIKKLVKVETDALYPDGVKMETLVRKLLKNEKVSSMMIDCCSYRFKANIKIGKPMKINNPVKLLTDIKKDLDESTPAQQVARNSLLELTKKDGYHHVLVTPPGIRPYVSNLQVGVWGEDLSGNTAAHETGHLMRLDDQYNNAGTKPGGKNDVMDWESGWPSTSGLTKEMLKHYGVSCNCCQDQKLIDRFWERLNRTMLAAMDAILTCNRSVLEQALKHLADQKKVIEGALIPLADKKPLIARLDDQVEKIKIALKNCPKEKVAMDSGTTCEFWPWEHPGIEHPGGVPMGGTFIIPDEKTPPTSTPDPKEKTPPTTTSVPEIPFFGFPFTVTPEDKPTTTPKEKEKPKGKTTTYAKVKQSVIEDGKKVSKPVVGIKMKFSKLAPPLPTKGNKKVDEDYDKGPDIAISDKNGEIKRKSGKDSSQSVPEYMQWYAELLENITGIREAVAAPDSSNRNVLSINYSPIESYIVRIKVDRNRKNWDKPLTYLGKKVNSHIIRSWVLHDILYTVINISKEPE